MVEEIIMVKIISYNVNGIRAAIKKGFVSWLKNEQPDIICLQEIKANKDQFDHEIFSSLGYKNFWHSAEKKGYSGVSILTKVPPKKIEYGTSMNYIDIEGRVLRVDFDDFSVMSVYVPSGTNNSRLSLKFNFMNDFLNYVKSINKKIDNLIICGDFNVCHKPIDIHDPVRNKNVSGFLPEERLWLDRFIDLGFVDSFRYINKKPHNYSWWSYRANSREKNKGWRIDYNFVKNNLVEKITNSYILNNVYHSDHCPVVLELN